jgi:hypothetical protein
MIVLDLFAGKRGWSEPFEARGHTCYTVELNPKFPNISYPVDILTLDPKQCPFKPDAILASPPCEKFSVLQIGRNWTKEHEPKNEETKLAVKLVEKTIEFIDVLQPKFFIIENPRAKLRKLPMMQRFEMRTVTYCHFAHVPKSECNIYDCREHRMKPTDLWGGFPPSLVLPPECRNGDPCHIAAARGSTCGSQGMDAALSAKIPAKLAEMICIAMERDLH